MPWNVPRAQLCISSIRLPAKLWVTCKAALNWRLAASTNLLRLGLHPSAPPSMVVPVTRPGLLGVQGPDTFAPPRFATFVGMTLPAGTFLN
jgi:hypothetical protein